MGLHFGYNWFMVIIQENIKNVDVTLFNVVLIQILTLLEDGNVSVEKILRKNFTRGQKFYQRSDKFKRGQLLIPHESRINFEN